MSALRRRSILPHSFRGRFLLVLLLVAVVPLALIGVWLTRSVGHAGQELLRSELDKSLEKISAPLAERWSYRLGELLLLTNNEVAIRTVGGEPGVPLQAADSTYLDQLFHSLATTILSFEYRDAGGRIRWTSPPLRGDSLDAGGRRAAAATPGPTMTVRLTIGTGGGAEAGAVVAKIFVSAIVPIDSALRLPNGALLQVVQRATGSALFPAFAPDSLLARDQFTLNGSDWLAVRRSLTAPEVDLTLAAPLAAYVQPFERAARTGILTLAVVALLALVFSGYLTKRLTSSLERLAIAADAVAGGDLEQRVQANGSDEVGRVARAFNSMMENLRRTLGELSQRQTLAAVGEYAASLSHEVRNGLTAIRVDLQRAEEKVTEEAPDRPLIARALHNVKRLDGIVSRSLHLSRSGRVPRRRLDLREVLATAAQGADSSFSERGATLERRSAGGMPSWILGDSLALEQLFLNLLLNAAQALRRGESASIVLDSDGAEARIVVTDTGEGIAPDDLARVLDPFFSTKADGTGLGLPIARQIAVAHGGSLRIESAAGEGTRVEVRLPLALAAPVH